MEVGEDALQRFFSLTAACLDERQRRVQAASMVEVLGRGGQARVAEATGMSRNTLIAGTKELAEGPTQQTRVRRPGAGPKRHIDVDPDLLVVLDSLVEPGSRGDPMSSLRWTLKSTRTPRRSTGPGAVGQIDGGVEVSDRARAEGVGRKPILDAQPGLLQASDLFGVAGVDGDHGQLDEGSGRFARGGSWPLSPLAAAPAVHADEIRPPARSSTASAYIRSEPLR